MWPSTFSRFDVSRMIPFSSATFNKPSSFCPSIVTTSILRPVYFTYCSSTLKLSVNPGDETSSAKFFFLPVEVVLYISANGNALVDGDAVIPIDKYVNHIICAHRNINDELISVKFFLYQIFYCRFSNHFCSM